MPSLLRLLAALSRRAGFQLGGAAGALCFLWIAHDRHLSNLGGFLLLSLSGFVGAGIGLSVSEVFAVTVEGAAGPAPESERRQRPSQFRVGFWLTTLLAVGILFGGAFGFMLLRIFDAPFGWALFALLFGLPFGALSAFAFAMTWDILRPQPPAARATAMKNFVKRGNVSALPFRQGLYATAAVAALTMAAIALYR